MIEENDEKVFHHTKDISKTIHLGVPIKSRKHLKVYAEKQCKVLLAKISEGNCSMKDIEGLLMTIPNLNLSAIEEISAKFPYKRIIDILSPEFYGSCVIVLSYFVDCDSFPIKAFQTIDILNILLGAIEKSQLDNKISDAIYKILTVVMNKEVIREFYFDNYILRYISNSKGPGIGKLKLLFEMALMEPALTFPENLAISHMIDEIMRQPSINQAITFMGYVKNGRIPNVPGFEIDVQKIAIERLGRSTNSVICKELVESAKVLEVDTLDLLLHLFDQAETKFQEWGVRAIREVICRYSQETLDNTIKFLLERFNNLSMNAQREVSLLLAEGTTSNLNAEGILALAKFATDSKIGVDCCGALLRALEGPNSLTVSEVIEDISDDLSDIVGSDSTELSVAAEALLEACKL